MVVVVRVLKSYSQEVRPQGKNVIQTNMLFFMAISSKQIDVTQSFQRSFVVHKSTFQQFSLCKHLFQFRCILKRY